MMATKRVDLDSLTRDEIRDLMYDLEVHKVELETQNLQLQQAQRETSASNERFRRLYDSAPTGYLTLDARAVVTEANLPTTATLGVPHSRLIGLEFSSFVADHCQDRWHLAFRQLIEGWTRTDLNLELVSAQGRSVDAQLVGIAVRSDDRSPAEIYLSLIDVTELRTTERALQAAISAATLAEERERRALAADLHDDAGQLLSLASLKLHALRDADATQRDTRTRELDELLMEARRRISSLSFQLSPPLLHDVGLIAAVQWLAEDLEASHGLSVKITEEQELDLEEDVRVTFYRAIRELLLNVAKHAGVKQAQVRISRGEKMTRIAVEDAGVGMPKSVSRHAFGLLALRQRVEQLGGSLETRSRAGRGTTVVVSLPTPHSDERGDP